MSLFHLIAMWGLRAILVWAAFEVGEPLAARGYDLATKWRDLSTQAPVMERLLAKASDADQRARTALARATNTQDAFVLRSVGPLAPADAAANFVREDLVAGGASDIAIAARAERNDGALTPILVEAQWRERAETNGRPLTALALRRPGLLLVSLSEHASVDGSIDAKAVFKVFATRAGGKI